MNIARFSQACDSRPTAGAGFALRVFNFLALVSALQAQVPGAATQVRLMPLPRSVQMGAGSLTLDEHFGAAIAGRDRKSVV